MSIGPELDAALSAKNRLEGKQEPKEATTAPKAPKESDPAPDSRRVTADTIKKYLDGNQDGPKVVVSCRPKEHNALSAGSTW
jgi:hypothetical protein